MGKPLGSCGILAALALAGFASCSDQDSDRIAEALELDEVSAYWAVRGQDEEQNHFIHPVIRFRVVNGTQSDVGYIQAMAVFKRKQFPEEPWGNAFSYSISDDALSPGEASDLITMRCDANFVSKDPPERMFDNPKWEEIDVEVFLRVGPSTWVSAASLQIPKQIGAPGIERFLEPEAEESSGEASAVP